MRVHFSFVRAVSLLHLQLRRLQRGSSSTNSSTLSELACSARDKPCRSPDCRPDADPAVVRFLFLISSLISLSALTEVLLLGLATVADVIFFGAFGFFVT